MEPTEENQFVNWRWGYVIVLAKFQLLFLEAGIAKSFGVLIPEMVVRFDTDYATVGFICSLPSTLIYLACPFVSLLQERTNHRLVALAGAIISGACLVSCSFCTHITVLGVLLALTGVGFACVFLPITLLVNSYFPDKFILMNSVALYGATLGATFLPFIVERLQEAYGFFGSFLVLGGISCNAIVCAAAIRQPILKKHSQRHHQDHIDESERHVTKQNLRRENNKTVESDKSKISRNDDGLSLNASTSDNEESQPVFLLEVENMPLMNTETDDRQNEVSNPYTGEKMKPRASSSWHKSCLTTFSFHSKLFLFNIPTYFLSSYSMYAWMLFLVPHAEQLDISQSRAVFLSSIAGIGGIFGRTLFIILIKKNANFLLIYIIAGIINTISLLLDFVGTGYLVRAGLAFIQGMCFFIEDTINFAIVKSTVPDQNDFKRASTLMIFLVGLGATAAGYATGFMFDVTQSYTTVFTIIGAIHTVVVVNVIITFVLLRNRTSLFGNNNQSESGW